MRSITLFNHAAHPVSLRFVDLKLEEQFRAQYIANYLWQIQVAQVLAIILYTLAVVSEIVIFRLHTPSAYIRLVVVVSSFATGLLLTFMAKDFYMRHYRIFNIYYVLLTGLSFIHAGMNAPANYSTVFYSGLFLCLVFNYMVIRQDALKAAASGLLLLVVYLLAVYLNPMPFKGDVLMAIYFIAINFLGVLLAYLIEYENKRNFLMMEQIRTDALELSDTNKNLELRVEERTRELEIAKNRAEESDRLKSSFLANMSHEIRTPMNGILGFTDLLGNPDLSGEEKQQYIRIINISGERMLRTVNNLIDISKIESGIIEPSIKQVDIVEVMDTLHAFFNKEAGGKGIDLVFDRSTDSPHFLIHTDQSFLESILSNLIKNAIKFTSRGKVTYGWTSEQSGLRFFVRDTGIGIPENRQGVIFERFVKADLEDRNAYEGAGIGLSIAKSYVEMLGGKIWLESRQGVGTTFYFTIPLRSEDLTLESDTKRMAREEKNEGIRQFNILVVDDDPTSSTYLQLLLRPVVNRVYAAASGKDAIALFRANPEINLVLLDIKMPRMDGFETARRLREVNTELVIVAQTAYAMSGDREKILDSGFNEHLSKPIKRELLIRVLQHFSG